MQWLIDIAKEAMQNWIYDNGIYRDRGDPAAYDWTKATLTADGVWRELDLSGIVDEHSKAVLLKCVIKAHTVAWSLNFRRAGNVNLTAVPAVPIYVANITHTGLVVVSLSDDYKIEYMASTGAWDYLSVVVLGWWL